MMKFTIGWLVVVASMLGLKQFEIADSYDVESWVRADTTYASGVSAYLVPTTVETTVIIVGGQVDTSIVITFDPDSVPRGTPGRWFQGSGDSAIFLSYRSSDILAAEKDSAFIDSVWSAWGLGTPQAYSVDVPGAVPATYSLAYSTSSDLSNPSALSGAALSGSVYVFADTVGGSGIVDSVEFFHADTFVQVERSSPYELMGGAPWNTRNYSDGGHTIRADLYPGLSVQTASFAINNALASYPNEPSGYTRFFEDEFNNVPSGATDVIDGYADHTSSTNLTTATVTNAPTSPTSALRTRFSTGLEDGVAPVNLWARDGSSMTTTTQYDSLYFSMRFKVNGESGDNSTYENQTVLTKFGFIAYGRDPNTYAAANDGFFALIGTGSDQAAMDSMKLGFRQQNNVARNFESTGYVVKVGQWHHLEGLFRQNDVGSSNGKLDVWLDGTKVISATDVVYRTDPDSASFYQWKWNPTWGGTGDDVRTQTDYVYIDHAYMSGASGIASASYPNEPESMTMIALLGFADSTNATVGECSESSYSIYNRWFTADATAPDGDGWVYRGRFYSGMEDGGSSFRFWCWSALPTTPSNDYPEIYISYWLKIEGSDFENQSTNTKMYYVGYGATARQNQSILALYNGTGDQAIQDSMQVIKWFTEMNDDGSDPGFAQANYTGDYFKPGVWRHFETWYKINDIGPTTDNGEFKVWLDGKLLAHFTGLRLRSDENPWEFYNFEFTPVWGGNSDDIRTRDDYWRVDQVYISARPSLIYYNEPVYASKESSERAFNALVEDGWTDASPTNFTIATDATAPRSPSNVGQMRFPAGFSGGNAPDDVSRYLNAGTGTDSMYVAYWVKIDPNWEAHTSGVNKIHHIWAQGGSAAGHSGGYNYGVHNIYCYTAVSQFTGPCRFQYRLQGLEADTVGDARNLDANLVTQWTDDLIIRGQWHFVETLQILNTPGDPDGEIHVWIDGTKIMEYTNIGWVAADSPWPQWYRVEWNPTWGGLGDTVDATMYMWIDHLRIAWN